jgi:hypothetical protein
MRCPFALHLRLGVEGVGEGIVFGELLQLGFAHGGAKKAEPNE